MKRIFLRNVRKYTIVSNEDYNTNRKFRFWMRYDGYAVYIGSFRTAKLASLAQIKVAKINFGEYHVHNRRKI